MNLQGPGYHKTKNCNYQTQVQEKIRTCQPMPKGKKKLNNEINNNQNETNQGKQTFAVG